MRKWRDFVNKIAVTVKIANQDYTISGQEEKDYVLSLASHVDEQIALATAKAPKVNNVTPVVLASINIADQYFKEKAKNNELMEKLADGNHCAIEFDERNSLLIDEQNENINKLFERIQQMDNIIIEKNNEIYSLQKDMEEKIAENQKLHDLVNQFQNDMYELQMQLESSSVTRSYRNE